MTLPSKVVQSNLLQMHSTFTKKMPNSKYMIDAVSKMCANKWLYLDKVKIKIILPFLDTQLLISTVIKESRDE